MRMSGPAKISVSLPIELKHILIVLLTAAASAEAYDLIKGEVTASLAFACILEAVGFAAFYSLVRCIFARFSGRRMSMIAVSAPAVFLALFFENRLALPVYLLWLLIKLCEEILYPELILCLAGDAVMIYAWFTKGVILDGSFMGKVIFAAAFILTASFLRRKNPVIFFLAVFLVLLPIPVRDDPINWDMVIDAANRVIDKTKDMTRSVEYYLSELSSTSSYHTGYSSLDLNGNKLIESDIPELEIKTGDNITFRYTDEETGQRLIRRRTLYLKGGSRVDREKLLDILFALYTHGVDTSGAYLFSRTGRIDITYKYLKTGDEIFPDCLISLNDIDGNEVYGSEGRHKKGYYMRADYLDVDYGSPFLTNILATPQTVIKKSDVSYGTMAAYVFSTYGVQLDAYVGEDEYASWQKLGRPSGEYLDTKGATDRMRDLADEVTRGCADDYDKCRAVEAYLRQYKYSRDTGSGSKGSTGSTEGMSLISDGFLFESGKGYCVHFASSMVMLLRLNGIPARLASGYRYSFPFDRQEAYTVLSSDAHVWPEAYIEGSGWIGFEPTAVYSTASERTWHRMDDSRESGPAGESYVSGAGSIPHPEVTLPDDSEEYPDDSQESGPGRLGKYVNIALIIIAAIAASVILLILFARAYKAVRYLMSDPAGKLKMDVKDVIMLIRQASGAEIEDRGVLSDYYPYIPDKYRSGVTEAFDLYYRIMYRPAGAKGSEDSVPGQGVCRVRELRNTMYKEYKRRFFKRYNSEG